MSCLRFYAYQSIKTDWGLMIFNGWSSFKATSSRIVKTVHLANHNHPLSQDILKHNLVLSLTRLMSNDPIDLVKIKRTCLMYSCNNLPIYLCRISINISKLTVKHDFRRFCSKFFSYIYKWSKYKISKGTRMSPTHITIQHAICSFNICLI